MSRFLGPSCCPTAARPTHVIHPLGLARLWLRRAEDVFDEIDGLEPLCEGVYRTTRHHQRQCFALNVSHEIRAFHFARVRRHVAPFASNWRARSLNASGWPWLHPGKLADFKAAELSNGAFPLSMDGVVGVVGDVDLRHVLTHRSSPYGSLLEAARSRSKVGKVAKAPVTTAMRVSVAQGFFCVMKGAAEGGCGPEGTAVGVHPLRLAPKVGGATGSIQPSAKADKNR